MDNKLVWVCLLCFTWNSVNEILQRLSQAISLLYRLSNQEWMSSWCCHSYNWKYSVVDQLIGKCIDGDKVVFQFSSVTLLCPTLQTHGLQHARLPCLSPTPEAYSKSCPLSQWCHATISFSIIPFSSRLQSFTASGSFSNESVLCIRWPKYWSFNFSISPSNEYWGLISFRIDWLVLLAVQGTLKSLLQHHSSKASVLWRSAFFIVQLSLFFFLEKIPEFNKRGVLSSKVTG